MRALLILLLFSTVSCTSKVKKEPKVHPAALSAQTYFVDWGMPIREVREQEDFFFKKCNVNNRGTYPTKTTYDCNEF
jgi:hypothetical protein